MQFSTDRLQVEITSTGCEIPADERTRIQTPIAALADKVHDLGEACLWINVVFHPRRAVYHAEFKLKLPGRSLFTGAEDSYLDAALQRSFAKLTRKVDAYLENPDIEAVTAAQRRAEAEADAIAPQDPAAGPLAEAANAGDYRAFREGLADYEIWLHKRVGRMVQRYPNVQARIGDELLIGDVVEEVFLNAFEQFTRRSTDVRLREWLDGLIEPSIRALMQNPDEEYAALDMARSVMETPAE